jgi:hypothetical protein
MFPAILASLHCHSRTGTGNDARPRHRYPECCHTSGAIPMVDMAAIAGAASALKNAYDISKAALGLRDAALIQSKILEMQREISSALSSAITAQTDQMTMLQRIGALEKEVADFETWNAEKERYELKSLGYDCFAYMLKPEARAAEPPHWICAHCFRNRRTAEIIQNAMIRGEGQRHVCPLCKNRVDPSPEAFDRGKIKWLD